MTAVIVALLYVTAIVVCFVWLGVVEDRIEAERQQRTWDEDDIQTALEVAEGCRDFSRWENEMSA